MEVSISGNGTLSGVALTADQVGSAAGALAFGAVGTYMLANNNSGGEVIPGATVAGSSIRPSTCNNPTYTGYIPAGTWRLMGYKTGGNTSWGGTYEISVFMRIL